MAKKAGTVAYKCIQCGYTQPKWLGRCPSCGEWNSMEEYALDAQSKNGGSAIEKAKPVPLSSVKTSREGRIITGIGEFDRVLGGGGVMRSAVLVGGEPGIGKSTLLLQAAAKVALSGNRRVLYVSGEESAAQIKSRADRLCLDASCVELLCASRLEDILDAFDDLHPIFVIIDSIQTIHCAEAGLVPGTVNQLKYCAGELVSWVKERDSVLIMTAHITKEGLIAGPKSIEHIVDAVIIFERSENEVRFLRAQKNRFGSVDELGIFAMTERGLDQVSDPSELFITNRNSVQPAGIACAAVFEGTRVFLVEIQALVVPAKASLSRVYSDKIDSARISRIAAVLEKRIGLRFCDQDIYINVAGGIRLSESAADAAIAAALYSARTDIAAEAGTMLTGEISLAGEIRPVQRLHQRVKTALSLGYKRIFTPAEEAGAIAISTVKEMVEKLFGAAIS